MGLIVKKLSARNSEAYCADRCAWTGGIRCAIPPYELLPIIVALRWWPKSTYIFAIRKPAFDQRRPGPTLGNRGCSARRL